MVNMLVLIWLAVLAIIAGLLFSLVFMQSQKKMPTQWRHWKTELQWQLHGFLGVMEDMAMRHKNRTELINLPGRLAVITGGNRGIGLNVITKLLKCEMSVVMGVRNPKQAKEAVERSIDLSTVPGKIYYERLDTGSMDSVRKFAETVKTKFTKIHLLINNAGIMAAPYALTEDGFESQLAVNYLGHFLLTHLLMPELRAAGTEGARARIINVSSCVHKIGVIHFEDIHGKNYYYPPEAYNQSKLAQVLFTKQLQKELNADQSYVQVHAVHPGVVDTELFCHSSTTYIPWFKAIFFKTVGQGSRSIIHAAISPKLEAKGGSYISNCTLVRSHAVTKDEALCAKLFAFTSDMLNIKKFGRTE